MTQDVVAAIARDFPELPLAGRDLWIVGGAVRDALLGRSSPDVDLAGDDAEAKAVAFARAADARVIPLGRERFPSWRVSVEGRVYDFTELTGDSIAADLARRDFTINAMAVRGDALEDPYDGRSDLRARIVRMVSRENLAEDPLRILKAIRMAATLDFELEPATRDACAALAPELRRAAPERIGAELQLIFGVADLSRATRLFRETSLDETIFGRPVPTALAAAGGDPPLAWGMIFRKATPGELREVAGSLRWSGAVRAAITALLRADELLGDTPPPDRDLDVFLHDFGSETAARLVRLRAAFGDDLSAAAIRRRLGERGTELFSIEPLLTGDEIAEIGVLLPGPDIGRMKRELLLAQIRGEVTTREQAIDWLRAR